MIPNQQKVSQSSTGTSGRSEISWKHSYHNFPSLESRLDILFPLWKYESWGINVPHHPSSASVLRLLLTAPLCQKASHLSHHGSPAAAGIHSLLNSICSLPARGSTLRLQLLSPVTPAQSQILSSNILITSHPTVGKVMGSCSAVLYTVSCMITTISNQKRVLLITMVL